MHRILLLFCLFAIAWPVWAAAQTSATAGPNAESPRLQPTAGSQSPVQTNEPPPQASICPERPPLAEGAPSGVVVELDPDTLWRPRGSEVRFTIRNPGGAITVTKVRVCFGWSSSDGAFRKNEALVPSPQVRSVGNDAGAIAYGAVVPFLHSVPNSDWWPRRIFASTRYIFTGLSIVPLTDMVVEVTTSSGPAVVTATQVGITDVGVAWAVVAAVTLLAWLALDQIALRRGVRGRNLLLRIISTQDGYASLSQLQIILWTTVVGLSATYVITLSGNLISVSDGTLVLLGIAGGAGLAARIPGTGPAAPIQPAGTVPVQAMPEWADLLIPDRSTREIDVTRVQMLAFTLITAGFMLIKVVSDYEIPAIPANFLVLMGISNGVYVGGRSLPSQPKNGGIAPGA